MLEFTPFNPFQSSAFYESSEDCHEHLPSQTESTLDDLTTDLDFSSAHTDATKSMAVSKKGSENHNMVKQLIITMKQMLNPISSEFGSTHNNRNILA